MPTSFDSRQPGRTLTCAHCGATFACDLSGGCWCMAEPYRLPLPESLPGTAAQDCLCPACLRKLADAQAPAAGNP
ncbi:MAG TPA: cysteine-rich CWC family protein [Rhizomicrobium sp.]